MLKAMLKAIPSLDEPFPVGYRPPHWDWQSGCDHFWRRKVPRGNHVPFPIETYPDSWGCHDCGWYQRDRALIITRRTFESLEDTGLERVMWYSGAIPNTVSNQALLSKRRGRHDGLGWLNVILKGQPETFHVFASASLTPRKGARHLGSLVTVVGALSVVGSLLNVPGNVKQMRWGGIWKRAPYTVDAGCDAGVEAFEDTRNAALALLKGRHGLQVQWADVPIEEVVEALKEAGGGRD